MDWLREIFHIEFEAAMANVIAEGGDISIWLRKLCRDDLEFTDIGGEG